MKTCLSLMCFLIVLGTWAQEPEKASVQQAIDTFFEAFHAKDSTALMATVQPGVVVQTIGKDANGEANVKNETFADLVRHITRIPDSISFKERLLDYDIKIDGPMAHAWTPYEFWHQGVFHHCGVNSFHLLKEEDGWKIIYLIDTRRKQGCAHKD